MGRRAGAFEVNEGVCDGGLEPDACGDGHRGRCVRNGDALLRVRSYEGGCHGGSPAGAPDRHLRRRVAPRSPLCCRDCSCTCVPGSQMTCGSKPSRRWSRCSTRTRCEECRVGRSPEALSSQILARGPQAGFFVSLGGILADNAADPIARQAAGLQMKLHLDAEVREWAPCVAPPHHVASSPCSWC